MIRDEANEFKEAVATFGKIFTDDIDNSEQYTEMLTAAVKTVREGADLSGMSKADTLKAVGLAFMGAGYDILNDATEFSDEVDGDGPDPVIS